MPTKTKAATARQAVVFRKLKPHAKLLDLRTVWWLYGVKDNSTQQNYLIPKLNEDCPKIWNIDEKKVLVTSDSFSPVIVIGNLGVNPFILFDAKIELFQKEQILLQKLIFKGLKNFISQTILLKFIPILKWVFPVCSYIKFWAYFLNFLLRKLLLMLIGSSCKQNDS